MKVWAKAALGMGLVIAGGVALGVYRALTPPPELKTYTGLKGVKSTDPLPDKMQRMAEQSALDAWTRLRVRVHISVHSLPEFDAYLDRLSKSSWFQALSEKDRNAEAILAGAFVGEAIRRTHGGTWLEESPDIAQPYPLRVGGGTIWPVTWCLKRLLNGSEDNIYDKYIFLVLRRTNDVEGIVTFHTNKGGSAIVTNIGAK